MELRRCPFCGGQATLFKIAGLGDSWQVMCDSCTAETESGWSEELAVEAWNRRVPEHFCSAIEMKDGWGVCSYCGGDVYDTDAYCSTCGAKVIAK